MNQTLSKIKFFKNISRLVKASSDFNTNHPLKNKIQTLFCNIKALTKALCKWHKLITSMTHLFVISLLNTSQQNNFLKNGKSHLFLLLSKFEMETRFPFYVDDVSTPFLPSRQHKYCKLSWHRVSIMTATWMLCAQRMWHKNNKHVVCSWNIDDRLSFRRFSWRAIDEALTLNVIRIMMAPDCLPRADCNVNLMKSCDRGGVRNLSQQNFQSIWWC